MKEELHRPTIRVLEILEYLATAQEGKTLTQISTELNYSKSTIFPILKTLLEYKYAQLDDNMHYSLGFRSCLLASSSKNSSPWYAMIHNEMQSIVDNCDEVCQLGVLDGRNVFYIDKIQSKRAVQLVSYIGKRLSASKTALGKTLLATLSDEQISHYFSQTQEELDKLMREVSFVRENGYAIDDREVNEETKCYAIALCKGTNAIAALSVSLPFFRDTKEVRENILNQLFEKKATIEKAFNASNEKIELIKNKNLL